MGGGGSGRKWKKEKLNLIFLKSFSQPKGWGLFGRVREIFTKAFGLWFSVVKTRDKVG